MVHCCRPTDCNVDPGSGETKKTFLAEALLRTESEVVFIFDVPCSAFSPLYGFPAHIHTSYSYTTLTRPGFLYRITALPRPQRFEPFSARMLRRQVWGMYCKLIRDGVLPHLNPWKRRDRQCGAGGAGAGGAVLEVRCWRCGASGGCCRTRT